MRNTSSNFPTSIDDRTFLHDISLDQLDTVNEYRNYIANGNYTQASELLNNSDVGFYGAWILNLFENRLVAIENYVQSLNKPRFVQYGGEEPTTQGSHWVE